MILDTKTTCPEERGFCVPDKAAELLQDGCPATYLAVYICALQQYCKGNLQISNEQIAERLKLSLIDVVNAFLFYSSKGLLKIHRFTSVDDGKLYWMLPETESFIHLAKPTLAFFMEKEPSNGRKTEAHR